MFVGIKTREIRLLTEGSRRASLVRGVLAASELGTTLNAPQTSCAAAALDGPKDKCESVNEQMLNPVSLQQNPPV